MRFYSGIFFNVKKLMKSVELEPDNEDICSYKKNIFTIL